MSRVGRDQPKRGRRSNRRILKVTALISAVTCRGEWRPLFGSTWAVPVTPYCPINATELLSMWRRIPGTIEPVRS